MTNRSIFNRKYTSFTSDSTEVWLANGNGNTTSAASSSSFTAGTDLIQGDAVYVSGVYVFPATAASGAANFKYNCIGLTLEAASASSQVPVVLDDVAVVSSDNIVSDTSLIPGEYYFLSKYEGKIVRYNTTSGTIDQPGGYGALVNLGTAINTTELNLEIQPVVELNGPGSVGPVPAPTSADFVAGVDLIQGEVVYVSGAYVFPATAASGNPIENYSPIGLTSSSASALSTVPVIFDDIASVSANNLVADSALIPGQYYYLSKYDGKLTRYSTASGEITASGGYAALSPLGLAFSATAFHVQLQQPTELFN